MNTADPRASAPTTMGVLRCFGGASLVCVLTALLLHYVPWSMVGHGIAVGAATIGTGLGWLFGHLWTILGWAFGVVRSIVLFPITLAAHHSVSGVWSMAFLLLGVVCIRFKYNAWFKSDEAARNYPKLRYAPGFFTIYLFFGLALVGFANVCNIGHPVGSGPEGGLDLAKTLYQMDASSQAPTFEQQVSIANEALGRYASAPNPVSILSVTDRTIIITTDLNLANCRALAQPNARFIAHTINGVSVKTAQDIQDACTYAWSNDTVLYTRPGEWLPPS